MYMSAVITTCLYTVGASASIREVSGKERESTWEQTFWPPSSKPLVSIYRRAEEDCLYFILLVG
jgi:hypothetical protein